jgi:hypothetical protein
VLDSSELTLLVSLERSGSNCQRVSLATGKAQPFRPGVVAHTPAGNYLLVDERDPDRFGPNLHLALCRPDGSSPLTVLSDWSIPAFQMRFNPAGNLLAWGNPDGTVSVCDLEQLRERLNEVQLGW